MDRRMLLTTGLVSLAVPSFAQTPAEAPLPSDPRETITLWPATPPGGAGLTLPAYRAINHTPPFITPVDRAIYRIGVPMLYVLRPDRPDGSAVIIAPGGGYFVEMLDFEGMDIARHLNARGVTCFVLRYRLPGDGWAQRSDVPLQDAQRAMRLVRANAAHYGVDAKRIGFMGFSAGGHVACSIATRFAAKVYDPVDAADGVSARPDFSAPIYPVVTMGEGCHAGSRDNLLGRGYTAAQVDAYSCQNHVPVDAPPSWMCLAADDTTVPPMQNAFAYYKALQEAKIASEMHVFESGGHGFGLAQTKGKPVAIWLELFANWAKSHGFFTA